MPKWANRVVFQLAGRSITRIHIALCAVAVTVFEALLISLPSLISGGYWSSFFSNLASAVLTATIFGVFVSVGLILFQNEIQKKDREHEQQKEADERRREQQREADQRRREQLREADERRREQQREASERRRQHQKEVDDHRREQQRRTDERKYERQLGFLLRLRDVNSMVEYSRLLMNAHDSAKTWSEQSRELIKLILQLSAMREELNAYPELFGEQDEIIKRLGGMKNYLQGCRREYAAKHACVDAAGQVKEHSLRTIVKENQMKWTNGFLNRDDSYIARYVRNHRETRKLMRVTVSDGPASLPAEAK